MSGSAVEHGRASGENVPTPAPEPVDGPHECTYCGRRFVDADLLALHRGLDHPAAIDEAERDAFRDAYEAEESELRLFRLKALLALVVLYFLFLFAFSVFA